MRTVCTVYKVVHLSVTFSAKNKKTKDPKTGIFKLNFLLKILPKNVRELRKHPDCWGPVFEYTGNEKVVPAKRV